MIEPIQADGPNLSSDAICDLCGNHGLAAQWTTTPFVHDYNLTGQSVPMRYSYPWAVCATCDALVSADDREGLREHVRGTEKTKALYEEIRSAGITGALEVTRTHLDQLHDDFWANKLKGGPLTAFDPIDRDAPSPLAGLPVDVREAYERFIAMVDEGLVTEADKDRLMAGLRASNTSDEARAIFEAFEASLRHQPTERIDVSMVPDVPGMPGRPTNIEVASGVNSQGKPFCHVMVDGKPRGQLTPNEVRSMAMQWLEAAEAAEHDSALLRWATTVGRDGTSPLDLESASALIAELRQFRGDDHTSTVPPRGAA
jgi:hypothetical protein